MKFNREECKVLETCIIVDNVPKANMEKKAKLVMVLKKIFGKYGNVESVEIPFEGDNGLGFCFIKYEKADEALLACKKLDGMSMDANHTLKCNKWSDYEMLKLMSKTHVNPSQIKLQFPDQMNSWLKEDYGADQFLTIVDGTLEVYENGSFGERFKLLLSRHDFSNDVSWTRKGSYLISKYVHKQGGFILWAGPNLNKLHSFQHSLVEDVQCSPEETFLVSYSAYTYPEEYFFWDLRCGIRVRAFPATPPYFEHNGYRYECDNKFKWCYNDRYFARIKKGFLYVYETPMCDLLPGMPIKFTNPEGYITEFEWSPSGQLLSIFTPEYGNNPARIILISIPDLTIIFQKNLFNVSSLKMYWQSSGKFLVSKIMLAKSKNCTNFELLRLSEKNHPIELIQVDEHVYHFSWEPNGKRFAIIHSADSKTQKPDISFFDASGSQYRLIKRLKSRSPTEILWSPTKITGIVAIVSTQLRTLEFYSLDEDLVLKDGIHSQNAFILEWDPTGRYLVGSSPEWDSKSESGWTMWSIIGNELHSITKNKFTQFSWRPRPPSPLTPQDESEISRDWKQLCLKYKKEDDDKRRQFADLLTQKKKKLKQAFIEKIKPHNTQWLNASEERKKIRNGYDSQDESRWTTIEETSEILVEQKTEVIPVQK